MPDINAILNTLISPITFLSQLLFTIVWLESPNNDDFLFRIFIWTNYFYWIYEAIATFAISEYILGCFNIVVFGLYSGATHQ